MSNLNHNVFKLLSEINPLQPFDPYNQYQNTNTTSTPTPNMSETSEPNTMEASESKTLDNFETTTPKTKVPATITTQVPADMTKNEDNDATSQGAAEEFDTKGPLSHIMDIVAQLNLLKSTDETAESSDANSTVPPLTSDSDWEMVANTTEQAEEEENESENTDAEWEMLEYRDAKPCTVPADYLKSKKMKKMALLKKIENKLDVATKHNKEEHIQKAMEYIKETKGDIKYIDRCLDEIEG
ncbi:hypothetical protein HYALB_00005865 [Hymenoscyphus albidus]|uniref:Uncharacterized protein n=1 Tax=Hymenoscyphus albidus TaxID=595503 RepID=A0A9N9Q621_9HELO|nr:hypothetical protein HYALB_00005865 [Hymenoscyphus albidus]